MATENEKSLVFFVVDGSKGITDEEQEYIKNDVLVLKEAMETAAEEGDDRTEDLLNANYQSLEKHAWMLSAFLGK